ncbi:MAG: transaldolase, partial [Elusimicrobia bacterium CG11_big_fil_rev_8_21_14_0_20_64_6]
PLDGPLDLGAQFYIWEIATALLGVRLGINPFDQPNVQAAKTLTASLLDALGKGAAPAALDVHAQGEGFTLSFSKAARETLSSEGVSSSAGTALIRLLSRREEGGYLALLPYLSPGGDYDAAIDGLRAALSRGGAAPVQMGYGPRYLHSTGQLHKGGPSGGLYLILTRRDHEPLAIPGAPYDFAQLISAQAAGDFQALDAEGRRAVFIQIQGDAARTLRAVAAAITDAEAPLRLS